MSTDSVLRRSYSSNKSLEYKITKIAELANTQKIDPSGFRRSLLREDIENHQDGRDHLRIHQRQCCT